MSTYYAGGITIQIEEYGQDDRGAPKYRGQLQLGSGETWPFADLSGWRGEMGAACDAIGFATAYADHREGSPDIPDWAPPRDLARKIEAAALGAVSPDKIPPGLERDENTDPKGGALYVGEDYVIADSRDVFARYIARCNAAFYREEGGRATTGAERVRLRQEEAAARAAAGLEPRRDAYAWPGGYPILYVDACENCTACPDADPGSVLCAECATDHMDKGGKVAGDVHWEGAPEECSACGKVIESAYGDPAEDRK